MRPLPFLLYAALLALPTIHQVPAQPTPEGAPDTAGLRLLDRLVAVVDDEPIYLSDLRRARTLAGVAPGEPGAGPETTDRELLDRLIERRLRLHEVDRYSDQPVPSAKVEESLRQVEDRVGGPEALDHLLAETELDRPRLRELLRRRLRVLTYIEERIGARIFIDEDDIREYHQTTLRRAMELEQAPLPPLETIADDIRHVLRQQALNREIETWTETLRRDAHIVDLLDRPPSPENLPPTVLELKEP